MIRPGPLPPPSAAAAGAGTCPTHLGRRAPGARGGAARRIDFFATSSSSLSPRGARYAAPPGLSLVFFSDRGRVPPGEGARRGLPFHCLGQRATRRRLPTTSSTFPRAPPDGTPAPFPPLLPPAPNRIQPSPWQPRAFFLAPGRCQAGCPPWSGHPPASFPRRCAALPSRPSRACRGDRPERVFRGRRRGEPPSRGTVGCGFPVHWDCPACRARPRRAARARGRAHACGSHRVAALIGDSSLDSLDMSLSPSVRPGRGRDGSAASPAVRSPARLPSWTEGSRSYPPPPAPPHRAARRCAGFSSDGALIGPRRQRPCQGRRHVPWTGGPRQPPRAPSPSPGGWGARRARPGTAGAGDHLPTPGRPAPPPRAASRQASPAGPRGRGGGAGDSLWRPRPRPRRGPREVPRGEPRSPPSLPPCLASIAPVRNAKKRIQQKLALWCLPVSFE